MEISVSELGPELAPALDAVSNGETVVIMKDGVPVARLTGTESASLLTRLESEGLVTLPASSRAVPRLPQAETAKDALSSLLGRMRR